MTDFLNVEVEGHVATVTMSRPDKRNCLGEPGDGEEFRVVANRVNRDRSIRCVVLTGAGSAFSAGGNLKAMRDKAPPFDGSGVEIAQAYRDGIHEIVRAIWTLEVPLVAAVNGPAFGLGNDMLCMADMRVASKDAIFGATFLKLGLLPGDGGAWLLPRTVGMARAAELLFTGRSIDAQTACEWGLVNEVVAPKLVLARAHELAREISVQAPEALRATKRLLRTGITCDFATLMEMSASMQALAHHTEDHAEAMAAYFEKRPPEYGDK